MGNFLNILNQHNPEQMDLPEEEYQPEKTPEANRSDSDLSFESCQEQDEEEEEKKSSTESS